jgi:hypothetical protein
VREHQRFCRALCRLAHFKRVDDDPRLPLIGDLDDLFREPFE